MAKNPTPSQLDPGQIIKRVFEDADDALRVDATVTSTITGPIEVIIDAATGDNIQLSDGVNLNTMTTVAGKKGIDVNVIDAVTATPTGLSTAIKASVMTVTDVASKVPATDLALRNGMSVRVWGAQTVYFGSSTVTAVAGYPKRQYEEISLDIQGNASVDLWAICASGQSSEIRILEVA